VIVDDFDLEGVAGVEAKHDSPRVVDADRPEAG